MGAKRQRILYNEEAVNYLLDVYGEVDLLTIRRELKKITGKMLTENAIRIKAYRLGIECMRDSRTCYLLKDVNELLGSTQIAKYARMGNFTRKVRGINGTEVDIEKFWKWAEVNDIVDFTKYERGTLLPEPKPAKSGKSWLDIRIEQQFKKKQSETVWDAVTTAKLKMMIAENKLSKAEMARKLNVTDGQLYYHINRLKLTTIVRLKITQTEIEEVTELYNDGFTIKELTDMYSRCRRTIKNIVEGKYDASGEGETP